MTATGQTKRAAQANTATDEDSRRPLLYLWFDTEFTSLDFEQAALLQVALVATDTRLNRVLPASADVRLPVRLDPDTPVSPWSAENLAGLIARCRSPEAVSVAEADVRLAGYARRAMEQAGCTEASPPILAGNSVHADRWIARRLLPLFSARLHYRSLDVTSFKLAWLARGGSAFAKDDPAEVRQWFPGLLLDASAAQHDAYFDVQASIAEMAFYSARLLRP